MSNISSWKPTYILPERYRVSKEGQVYSLLSNKLLKPTVQKNGYIRYKLAYRNGSRNVFAHRLVACAFIPNPEGKPYVDHINGDKFDNRAENLRWVTAKENTHNPATYHKQLRSFSEKGKGVVVYKNGIYYGVYVSISEAAKQLGLSAGNVSGCLKGRRSQTNGYTFKFWNEQK